MDDQIYCPKCGSTQITANKKGFSGGKAVAGAVLTGGIGLLAGTIGSKKIIITCLNCGKQFKPGEGKKQINTKVEWKTLNEPKLIWDAELKKHVINPNYKNNNIDYEQRRKTNKLLAKVFCPIFGILGVVFFASDLITMGVIFILIFLFFLMMAMSKVN